MKLNQALSYDWDTFRTAPQPEQRQVLSTLNKTVGTRISTLHKKGITDSFAERKLKQAGGILKTKNKQLNTYEMWRAAKRDIRFINSQTSTVKGYNQWIEDTSNRLFAPNYSSMSTEQRNNFWALYNQMVDDGFLEEAAAHQLSSDEVQTLVYDMYERGFTYQDASDVERHLQEAFSFYGDEHSFDIEDFIYRGLV